MYLQGEKYHDNGPKETTVHSNTHIPTHLSTSSQVFHVPPSHKQKKWLWFTSTICKTKLCASCLTLPSFWFCDVFFDLLLFTVYWFLHCFVRWSTVTLLWIFPFGWLLVIFVVKNWTANWHPSHMLTKIEFATLYLNRQLTKF